MLLKKAMARLVEEMPPINDDEACDSHSEGEDFELAVFTNGVEATAFKCLNEEASFTADSECRGAHICRSPDMLES